LKVKTLVIDWWYACAVQRSHSDEAGADKTSSAGEQAGAG